MKVLQARNLDGVFVNVRIAEHAFGGEMVDPAVTRGQLSCAKIYLDPNASFERHIHPSDHLLLILEGDGYLSYWEQGNEEEIRMSFVKGDVFAVPRELHHAVTAGPKGLDFLAIGTPARLLQDSTRMKLVHKHEGEES